MPETTPISLDNLADLGVDASNRLYWKGEEIVTVTMVEFPMWVDWAVGVGAAMGSLAALITVLRYLGVEPSWPWSRN